MTPAQFIAEARSHLLSMQGESGAILYSSFATLRPGRFYVLGLNPGGSRNSGSTIAQCLDGLTEYKGNAYLDEDWSSGYRNYSAGEHPLQRHLRLLMEELWEDLRQVCAANLIFRRSPNQHGAGYPKLGRICWPVHEMILKVVKPSVIIAFGNGRISPYAFFALKHCEIHGVWPTEADRAAEFRNWKCKAFQTELVGLELLVLGIPHLSRFTPEGRPKVVNWIKDKIREHDYGAQYAK